MLTPKDALSLLESNKKVIDSWKADISACPVFEESKDMNPAGKMVTAERTTLTNPAQIIFNHANDITLRAKRRIKKDKKADPFSKTRIAAETIEDVLNKIFELAKNGEIQSEHILPKDKTDKIQLALAEMGFDIFASYDGKLDVYWSNPNPRPLTLPHARCQVFYFTDKEERIYEG